ncbi:tudor domain-containing protein 1 [Brachyhypopomus gauderio]|uniref:tudor domain-containing protein 1 n=1 Tax=Brachyhypopomus gauderio TaxID=698409 RepID=UPI00404270DE
MNRGFTPSLVRPNLPLRRPATSPGSVSPRHIAPLFNDIGTCLPKEQNLANGSLDAFKSEATRKETESTPLRDNRARAGPVPVTPRLCNYCSQQGSLRCTRCKKTCYCSVACQTEDWKAHRHICKPCIPENGTGDKPNGPGVLESKVNSNDVAPPKRVFLRDLRSNSVSSGDELQGTVVEMRNPGKFFIHIQSVEMTNTLKNITTELQRTYGISHAATYKPEVGEICTVKFSLDQNWYRGEIISVDLDHQTAKALYIDFGNEEDVTFDRLRPLPANLDIAPPCALQCCIAGVTAVTGVWSGECSIAVRQLVAGKTLTFTVVDSRNSSTLLTVDVRLSAVGKNLSTFLIEQDYAIKEGPSTKPRTEQDIASLMTASFENFKRLSSGKNENTEAQPPEPLTQGVGDTFTAIVTHLQSPSEIICQKLENASVIQQLQMSLREHCSETQASEDFRPAPGTVCCSLFSEDHQWYRAKVLAYSSEDRVCVGYVDFGNSEEVTLNHLRPISVDLLSLATQAIPCHLAGVKPTSETWSEDAVMMLKRLVCNRFIKVEILGQRDGMALVSMVDESSDPQTNIAELLVTTGYAAEGNVEAEEVGEGVGSENAAVDKLVWSCAELPIDGQKVVLVISVLENPGEFYCYNYNAEDMQTLAELSSALIKHCEGAGGPFSPAVGEPCCALYSGDGNWYRAMVQSVEGTGKARVCFVDYGNSCEVEVTALRAIHPSMLKLPFQAIRCWLAGVEPVGGRWSKEAVRRFQALCVGKQLCGRVLSITEKGYGVELECGNLSVAAVLISEQLAQPLGQDTGIAGPALRPGCPAEVAPVQTPVLPKSPPLADRPADVTGTKPAPLLPCTSASFTLDWKTPALPCNETFQPQVAAVVSPSLFYVMNPRKANVESLQAVMTDVAQYCSRQPQDNQTSPPPGAACCAQFSGDQNWYRAVVLDTTSTHASVIYADFGNVERVPVSSVLPIPDELLQQPFQIARCALSGSERFPAAWPPEVLELFNIQLDGRVQASVHSFDGVTNLLMLTQHPGTNINSVILGAMQKPPSKAGVDVLAQDTQAPPRGQTQAGSAAKAIGCASSADAGKAQHGPTEKKTTKTSMENKQLQATGDSKDSSPVNVPSSACCCVDLKQKIDHVEELILLLLKQMGGNEE